MELRHYWHLVSAHKVLVVAITIFAALATLAGTYLISPTYTAAALVQVLPGEQDPQSWLLRTGDQVNLPMMRDPTETFTQSTIEFITSRPVAEEVVRRLDLDKPEPPGDWIQWIRSQIRHVRSVVMDIARYGEYREKAPFEAAVDEVQHSLSGKLVKGTYMFQLVVKAKKPDLAARMAQTTLDIAVEQGGAISRQAARDRLSFIETQAKKQADQLHAVQKSVNDLRQSDQILSDVEQAAALVKARYATQDLYEKSISDLEQARTRLNETERQLQATPRELTSAVEVSDSSTTEEREQNGTSTVGANTVTTVTTTSGSQDSETSSSSSQQGRSNAGSSSSSDSQYSSSSSDNNSDATTKSSNSGRSESTQSAPPSTTESTQTGSNSIKTSSTSRTTAPNPTYQNLLQARLELERHVEGLKVAGEQYTNTLKAKDEEIATWIQRDAALSNLRLEERLAGDSYARLRAAVVDEILHSSRPTEQLRIMEQATPPLYPSQPLRGLYVLGALAAGLLVGVSLAFLIEYYKMSIRTAAQAQTILNIPVLVRVPKLPARSAGSKPSGSEKNGHA